MDKLDAIPVLHVRGTNYAVGYAVGKQFKSMINNLVSTWSFFNESVLPIYDSPKGKNIYDKSLKLCREKFPKQINELRGISDGSDVPFFKIFLLHIDSLLSPTLEFDEAGCTSVLCKDEAHEILGHTEDAFPEFLNHIYILDAEIIDQNGQRLEKFCSLAYAGHLPGYTMGYNSAGLIYSINTLYPDKVFPEKTPRNFITRALLGATNLEQVLEILRDFGSGTSDGFSVNLIICNADQETAFYNIEVAPNGKTGFEKLESDISVVKLQDCVYAHCNKYLRICIPEIHVVKDGSSFHRHNTIDALTVKQDENLEKHVKNILSDESNTEFPIFRNGKYSDNCATIAVGIFDVLKMTWSIYINPPATSSPVAVLPLSFNIKSMV